MKRLEGRRAIVTGGGSGIGRQSAIRFAREGASVLVVGRSANTEETVDLIRAEGGSALAMVADASIEANVEAMVRRCIADLGIPKDEFERAMPDLSTIAFDDPSWQSNPRMPLVAELIELFWNAYRGRNPAKIASAA